MTESSIIGKVVGEPVCSDPHHAGLKFSIDTGNRRQDFQVAGDSPLEQSPLSALAMSVALAAAAQRGFDVQVIYDKDFPDVALGVVLPYPNPNHPAEGGDTLSNPYRETVNTMAVLDFGGGPRSRPSCRGPARRAAPILAATMPSRSSDGRRCWLRP